LDVVRQTARPTARLLLAQEAIDALDVEWIRLRYTGPSRPGEVIAAELAEMVQVRGKAITDLLGPSGSAKAVDLEVLAVVLGRSAIEVAGFAQADGIQT
jgi:hypothetical protein